MACPAHRDLTVGYTSLHFIENAHVLDLTVGYTSSPFDRHLEAFWGAADLSIVYAFLLFTHETNMFTKRHICLLARAGPLLADPRRSHLDVSEGVKSHAVIGLYTSFTARPGAPAATPPRDAEFAS